MATTAAPAAAAPTSVAYSQIASRFLADLGAPDNKETNTAVVTWVKGESGGVVYSNNPWNIHYDVARQYNLPGVVGSRTVPNGEVVAVFSSLNDGIDASAKYISYNQHGYPAAVSALRAGDAVGFLNGIAASDWAGGHYGAVVNSVTHTITGGTNSLIAQYHTNLGSGNVGGAVNATVTTVSLDKILTAIYGKFGDVYNPNDILTQQYIDNMHSHLYGDGSIMNTGVTGLTTAQKDQIMAILNANKGKPLGSIGIPVDLAAILGVKAAGGLVGVGPTDPQTGAYVGPGSDIAATIAPLVKALLDPSKWLGILALGVGVVITGYGIIVLVRSYGASTTPEPTVPTPPI